MSKIQSSEHLFAVCVHNDGYPASLEVRKLCQVMEDPSAGAHHYIKVIDETGDNYLYPEDYFMPVELPPSVIEALLPVAWCNSAGLATGIQMELRKLFK